MINNSADFDLVDAKKYYQEAFAIFKRSTGPVRLEIQYYPYVNINHTIRVRNEKVYVKISSLFKSAPTEAHRALAFILVAKLLKKNVPKPARETYRRFVNSKRFQIIALEHKRKKGRKVITTSKGTHFDLEGIFEKLNVVYFGNSIPKPALTWSPRKTFRRLGHFDAAHESISISKTLDDRDVPKFVVEYVVYHEMLHIKHPTQHRNGRRYNHTPAFKRDEEKFMYFKEAEEWIELNALNLRKKTRKQ